MRACLALLSVATPIVLTGCMPVMDIELYNDTGQDIVVSGIAGAEKTVSIPQRKSKPLDLLTIQQGQPEKLAVMTPTASWFYPHCQKLFVASAHLSGKSGRSTLSALLAELIHMAGSICFYLRKTAKPTVACSAASRFSA